MDGSSSETHRNNRAGRFAGIGFAVLFTLILTACAGEAPGSGAETSLVPKPPTDAPMWLWDSRPQDGDLVFTAAGARQVSREEESVSALEDAALQAGVFAGFWGASQDYVTSTTGGTGRRERTRAYYDGAAADRAFETMDAERVWRDEEATWVRFRLSGIDFPKFDWVPVFRGDGPAWPYTVPDIPGWRTAVGIGGTRSTMAGTLRSADEAALAEMVEQIHGASRSVTVSREASTETWSESSGAAASYGSGFGAVRGFLIVARWIDAKGNGWALAVCPRAWNSPGD